MTNDPRFRRTAVLGTWQKLKMSGRLLILDDSLTSAELTTAVTRISGMPAKDRSGAARASARSWCWHTPRCTRSRDSRCSS